MILLRAHRGIKITVRYQATVAGRDDQRMDMSGLTRPWSLASPAMKQRQQKKLSHGLFEAILSGDARSARTLLRSGASPERRSIDGTTPLYLASVQGEAEVAL